LAALLSIQDPRDRPTEQVAAADQAHRQWQDERSDFQAALRLWNDWQTQRKIVLPQALAMVVPGIMNNFISTFKDTSLVTIVSMYELTGSMGMALNSDANWRPFKIEGYLFIALIYFVFCFSMSRYSSWIEKQVNKSRQR